MKLKKRFLQWNLAAISCLALNSMSLQAAQDTNFNMFLEEGQKEDAATVEEIEGIEVWSKDGRKITLYEYDNKVFAEVYQDGLNIHTSLRVVDDSNKNLSINAFRNLENQGERQKKRFSVIRKKSGIFNNEYVVCVEDMSIK